jgi:hypothetical protein
MPIQVRRIAFEWPIAVRLLRPPGALVARANRLPGSLQPQPTQSAGFHAKRMSSSRKHFCTLVGEGSQLHRHAQRTTQVTRREKNGSSQQEAERIPVGAEIGPVSGEMGPDRLGKRDQGGPLAGQG